MAKNIGKKFAWVIKDFSSLQSEKSIYSVPVLIGDYKWRLCAYPKGCSVDVVDKFSLFLELVDYESLPSGWRLYVKFRLTIAAHEAYHWFDKVSRTWGFLSMILLTKLHEKDAGYIVNGDVHIVAEVDVLEVIDTFDASIEKSKELSSPLKIILNDDCPKSNVPLKEASSVKESIVVNGFQVLPSQVESVRHIFKRHPDIAVNFCAKNQHLRTTCINFLLSLIETLCKPLQELSNEDLVVANIALTYLKDVKFKVDWLEKKLDDVKEKKVKEQSALAQLQETEEIILILQKKLSELDAQAEEQKAELLATRTPLSFDKIV